MIWYFAYGSNLDPERFGVRVGPWQARRAALLEDHVLRFSGEVTSEGGGGAIILPESGARVHGGVYRLSEDQIAILDGFELGGAMDPALRGVRRTVEVDTDEGTIGAEIYLVPAPALYRAPSTRYLGHITRGLRAFGYDEAVIAAVERQAASEPGWRPA